MSLVSEQLSVYTFSSSLLFKNVAQQRETSEESKTENMKLVKNRNTWFRKLINSTSKVMFHSKNIALMETEIL